MKYFELFINLRYLRSKRKQVFVSIITIISMAGIFLGVAALIIVLAVMNGFAAELRNKILGINSHLVVTGYGGEIDNLLSIRETLAEIPGVQASSAFIVGQGMIKNGQMIRGTLIKGVVPEEALRVINLGKMYAGEFSRLSSSSAGEIGGRKGGEELPGIVAGVELARHLDLRLHDTVSMVSPFGVSTPMGQIPRVKKFVLVGIFESGFYEYDSSLVFMSLKDAQGFFNMDDRITGVEVKLDDIYRAEGIAREISKKLGLRYWVRTWMEMNKNLFSALKLERRAMFVILSLIVLVAAFNIIATLIMIVMEKNRDIAILKALGATSRSIMKIFVLHGLTIGVAGTILGCIAGLAVSYNLEAITMFIENLLGFKILPADIYYLSHLPSQVVYSDVVIIAVTAISISLLATIYPSWKAARLDPVEILRNE